MGWWNSVVDSAKFVYKGLGTISKGIGSSVKWLWNNASVSKAVVTAFTYGANTFFQGMKQIMALQKAVPALIYHPATRQIVGEVAHLMAFDVLPMIALNAVNNGVQNYFREGQPEDAPWLAPYSLFLSGLTFSNFLVRAYTWRQGAQATARMTVIAINAPSAFYSNKEVIPKSLCEDLKCSVPRQLKGVGREQVILAANGVLVFAISCIPVIGDKASFIISIICNGRYITRVVTPERCEDHKAMMQESVWALGVTNEVASLLMDWLLESTIGLPPFLYHRILKQILLLAHINIATYMNIPLIKPKDATIRLDFLNHFEWLSRFASNVIYAGLAKRVPIDLKPPKDTPPLIPLSPTLQLGTEILRSDLDKEELVITEPVVQLVGSPGLDVQSVKAQILKAEQDKKPEEQLFSKQRFNELLTGFIDTVKPWALPPMFQSTTDFINDPIVREHWPAIREGGIATIDAVKTYGKNNATATLAWAPKGVATVLYWAIGIPKFLTRVSLMLTNENDFWDLANALKAWFERHDIKFEVKLAEDSSLTLLEGTKKVVLPSAMKDSSPVLPVEGLITQRPSSTPLTPVEDLLSMRNGLVSDKPEDLLTTRRRKFTPKSSESRAKEEEKTTTVEYISLASNPESLFTTRKRNTNGVTYSNSELVEHTI